MSTNTNVEYKLYGIRYYNNPSVLDMNGCDGIVFCSKNSTPYKGRGVYKIVHRGLDKRQKLYAIAEPVFAIPVEYPELYGVVQRILNQESLWYCDRTPQEHVRFNHHLGRKVDQLVTIEDIIAALKTMTPKQLNSIFATPIDCDGVDFEILSPFRHRYKAGDTIWIRYTTGESEYQSIGWIYKNHERLTNATIAVYGQTLDSLEVEFIPTKEETAV